MSVSLVDSKLFIFIQYAYTKRTKPVPPSIMFLMDIACSFWEKMLRRDHSCDFLPSKPRAEGMRRTDRPVPLLVFPVLLAT